MPGPTPADNDTHGLANSLLPRLQLQVILVTAVGLLLCLVRCCFCLLANSSRCGGFNGRAEDTKSPPKSRKKYTDSNSVQLEHTISTFPETGGLRND